MIITYQVRRRNNWEEMAILYITEQALESAAMLTLVPRILYSLHFSPWIHDFDTSFITFKPLLS